MQTAGNRLLLFYCDLLNCVLSSIAAQYTNVIGIATKLAGISNAKSQTEFADAFVSNDNFVDVVGCDCRGLFGVKR